MAAAEPAVTLYPSWSVRLSDDAAIKLDAHAAQHWDRFYRRNRNRFFKDRHYLFREFPLLAQPGVSLLEVGCGVGNTSLPVAAGNVSATVHSCDYSATAIDILRRAPDFDAARMHAFVADMTKDDLTHHVPMASLDAVTCVFALSANAASALPHAIQQFRRVLRPGRGAVFVRDYAAGDLAQHRLAADSRQKQLAHNFYVRGDGTRCLYFTEEGLRKLFAEAGFVCVDLHVHARTVANRRQQSSMSRRWIQGVFCLPPGPADPSLLMPQPLLDAPVHAERVRACNAAGAPESSSAAILASSGVGTEPTAPGLSGARATEAGMGEATRTQVQDARDTGAMQIGKHGLHQAGSEQRTAIPPLRTSRDAALQGALACMVRSNRGTDAQALSDAPLSEIQVGPHHFMCSSAQGTGEARLEVAKWLLDTGGQLLTCRHVVDLTDGPSALCGLVAVRSCARYTYAHWSHAARALLQRQLAANASTVLCERVRLQPAHDFLRWVQRRPAQARRTVCDAVMLCCSSQPDALSAQDSLGLARSLLPRVGLAVVLSNDGSHEGVQHHLSGSDAVLTQCEQFCAVLLRKLGGRGHGD